jgi:hypothetical protein
VGDRRPGASNGQLRDDLPGTMVDPWWPLATVSQGTLRARLGFVRMAGQSPTPTSDNTIGR